MFGELLPPSTPLDRAVPPRLRGRPVLLVVGSSLEVYPIAGLPLETLAAGGKLAIVNRGRTQFDRDAPPSRIDAGAGETLRRARGSLLRRLE